VRVGAELVASVDERHVGHSLERKSGVERRVAASHHDRVPDADLLDGRQTIREAPAEEPVFAVETQAAGREAPETQREDEGGGRGLLAGAPQDETVGARAGVFDRLPLAQLGAEARRLLGEPHREVTRQHVCLGGKVGHGLAGIQVDELSAEGLGLEGHDRHAAHRGVHRRRQTAGAAADDGEIVGAHLMLRSEGCSHLKASTISAHLHTKFCEAVTPGCAD
jgi:hypothetical protein